MKTHVCPWWFAYTFDNRIRRLFHKPEKILGPYVKQGMTVMDVGCGMGFFSMGLAKLVGHEGHVISADLQQQMLDILKLRAKKAGVARRIKTHLCQPGEIGVDSRVDFALAFWMVHEVPDTDGFFDQIQSILRPGARFLMAEPKFHVPFDRFKQIIDMARQNGLKKCTSPRIGLSWSALFEKREVSY